MITPFGAECKRKLPPGKIFGGVLKKGGAVLCLLPKDRGTSDAKKTGAPEVVKAPAFFAVARAKCKHSVNICVKLRKTGNFRPRPPCG